MLDAFCYRAGERITAYGLLYLSEFDVGRVHNFVILTLGESTTFKVNARRRMLDLWEVY